MANQLGGQLTRLGVPRAKSFANQLKGEQERDQTAQAFQNIQNIYADPNLSDEQKVMGVYQELSSNPTLAHNLIGSMQQPGKNRAADMSAQQYAAGYNALQSGDQETFDQLMSDPETPLPVKKELNNLRRQQQTRKSVQDREQRLRQTEVAKAYKRAIDSENNKLKTKSYVTKADRAELEQKVKQLENFQKRDMKRLKKDPNAYFSLSLWNNMDPEFLPDEELEGGFEVGDEAIAEQEQSKVKFDPKNPEHIARFEELDQQFKGDRKKVNAALAKEFSP